MMNQNQRMLFEFAQQQKLHEMTNTPVLVFRAGKCNKKGDIVYPLKKKGEIQVFQQEFLKVRWKERAIGVTKHENEFIILPNSARWFKVKGVEGGRVYCLEFKDDKRQEFFWMQDPKDTNDEKHEIKFNELINGGKNNKDESHQKQLIKEYQNTQREKERKEKQRQENKLNINYLENILSGLGGSSSNASNSTTTNINNNIFGQQQNLIEKKNQVKLSEILSSKQLIETIKKKPEIATKLIQFLPKTETDEKKTDVKILIENLQSPQFQKTVRIFDEAIRTGQIAINLQSFGLDPNKTGGDFGVEGFLKAVVASVDKKNEKNGKGKDKMDIENEEK